MRIHEIAGRSGRSRILVGAVMEQAVRFLPEDCPLVIVTDHNVQRIWGHRFPDAHAVIPIGMGEGIKTIETVRDICARLVEAEADRSVFLLGIGGGIVCDITGFVASTYLRGVRFGYMATTLLAQVDAAVGGKTGVNFMGYKNMIGTFSQPEIVFCDPRHIATLPASELGCGFSEVVKHGAIADEAYFSELERLGGKVLDLDPGVMEAIVSRSVEIKAGVVGRDEEEAGERRKLNFGHTLGHALEKTTGMRHGHAVSVGMAFAARLSAEKGLLSQSAMERLENLLGSLDLPVRADADAAAVVEALGRDKKRRGDIVHFVLLRGIGEAVIETIPLALLRSLISETVSS